MILQENIEIEEVFVNLRCGREGLTAEDAEQRLTIFGYNKLEEKEVLPTYMNLVFFNLMVICGGDFCQFDDDFIPMFVCVQILGVLGVN